MTHLLLIGLTCSQVPLHGGDGCSRAVLGGRRVVVLGQMFAVWQPEMAPGVDHHVPAFVVVDHGPVVDAKVVSGKK